MFGKPSGIAEHSCHFSKRVLCSLLVTPKCRRAASSFPVEREGLTSPWGGSRWACVRHSTCHLAASSKPLEKKPRQHGTGNSRRSEPPRVDPPSGFLTPLISVPLAAHRQAGSPGMLTRGESPHWKSTSNLELMSIWVSSCSLSFIRFVSHGGHMQTHTSLFCKPKILKAFNLLSRLPT